MWMRVLAKRLFATVFLSVLLASLLSLIPMLEQHGDENSELPVFEPATEKKLSENQLVDFLLSQSLRMQLKRVDWKNEGSLFLELEQTPGMSQEAMYRELFRIVKNCLVETENIQIVRLYVHGANVNDFLLEAGRKQIAGDPQMKNINHWTDKKYLEEMFEITRFSSS
ncbi:hypothetical protein [Lihuaxuella thermophila]|uniref:Uncharacterized protein n=1 Tax=Lihuaxuella thermophila TaxID=1173111 RepID=A0A1H8F8H3_9BACL|nr:hypothetical protein [Lihuaxuella thermophila]SEN27836.1 hypothetical protein SAMN05444955_10859 [Lihuaxuella thermophila]